MSDATGNLLRQVLSLGALAVAGLMTIGAAKPSRTPGRQETPSPTERRIEAYEAARPGVRHSGGNVTPPKLIVNEQPRFPPAIFARRRTGGIMILEAVVDEHGVLKEPIFLKGVQPDLQPYVLDALRKWRYEPATLKGKPVPVFLTLVVNICFA
jgi:hypothetical protein